ncbi:glycosyltransferase family 2 protein [Chitinophagaceae bacterium MMS25-I14]
MKLSVIIVNYNVKYFLEVCLHSVLRAAKGFETEIIVVDNNSRDGSCTMVREKFPSVILIENKDNKGFSKANNQGVEEATGEYILFLNPDTVMPEDFFRKTVAYMDSHPEAGAVGPRLIDGKGQFAPDGKKSFPSLSVALFKTTGINKIFSKSPYFNKYYAVHIGEHQTAPVDVLSGCCMLVRHHLLKQIGGAFDEDYFMYCEDVDLSYRIQKAGYQNVYFPEATLVHYKGESTRKATLSYVRIFNEALSTFVKKHYSKQQASLFILFINIGIVLRAILSAAKQVLKVLRMPLFDALILLLTLYFMEEFWVSQVKNIMPISRNLIYATFPVYILLWVLSMYLNGAYDQSYRALRVVRGMLIGTVFILAYYGLLQAGMRYSRAIIVLSGFTGTVILLGLHALLYKLGIFKFIPYDTLPKKAVIVANEEHYKQTASILQKVHYAPELEGRIYTDADKDNALSGIGEMKQLLYTAGINEVIFCVNGLSYEEILEQMQECGGNYDYKIHLPGTQSFVGSNSSHTSGDLYTADFRYNLSSFAQQRNKRVFDLVSSLILLFVFPFSFFLYKKPGRMLRNCISVLAGKKTWIGYGDTERNHTLPKIKESVVPAYFIQEGYMPSDEVVHKMNTDYARAYSAGADFTLLIKNFKFL